MTQGTKMLKEIIEREGTNERGNHVMDFSKKEHWDCICEMFGGKEHLKSEYPLFYEKMLKTAERAKDSINQFAKGDAGLVDTVYIRDTVSNKETTGASGLTCLTAPAVQFFHSMTLIQGDKEIGRNVAFSSDKQVAVLNASIDSSRLVSSTDLITGLYHCVWEDQETGMLRAETSTRQDIAPLEDPILSIEVIHPCYYYGNSMSDLVTVPDNPTKKTPVSIPKVTPKPEGRTTINSSFKRQFSQGEVVDYDYPDTTKGNGKEMYQDVQLKISLDDGYNFDQCTSAYLILEITGGTSGVGSLFHKGNLRNTNNVYAFEDASDGTHGFYFLVPTDWSNVIKENSYAGDKTYRLEMSVYFTCVNSETSYLVSVSSEKGITQNEAHHAIIPKLRLMWGCLKEGTLVAKKVEDKRKDEMIENIHIGDIIFDENNNPVEIINKIDGLEDYVIHIETEDNHTIEVSMNHPMMTDHGGMPASHILPSYKLKMENGEFQSIRYIYQIEGKCKVYSVELASGHWFLANGFVTGDNYAQGVCITQANGKTWRTASPEEVAEIEKMNAEFGINR